MAQDESTADKTLHDRPSVPSSGPEVAGAGPLTGHVLLLWSVFSSLLFTAIFIVTTWSVFCCYRLSESL